MRKTNINRFIRAAGDTVAWIFMFFVMRLSAKPVLEVFGLKPNTVEFWTAAFVYGLVFLLAIDVLFWELADYRLDMYMYSTLRGRATKVRIFNENHLVAPGMEMVISQAEDGAVKVRAGKIG